MIHVVPLGTLDLCSAEQGVGGRSSQGNISAYDSEQPSGLESLEAKLPSGGGFAASLSSHRCFLEKGDAATNWQTERGSDTSRLRKFAVGSEQVVWRGSGTLV